MFFNCFDVRPEETERLFYSVGSRCRYRVVWTEWREFFFKSHRSKAGQESPDSRVRSCDDKSPSLLFWVDKSFVLRFIVSGGVIFKTTVAHRFLRDGFCRFNTGAIEIFPKVRRQTRRGLLKNIRTHYVYTCYGQNDYSIHALRYERKKKEKSIFPSTVILIRKFIWCTGKSLDSQESVWIDPIKLIA